MRSTRWVLGVLVAIAGLSRAKPVLDQEALATIPLDDAIVLSPVGDWWFPPGRQTQDTLCMALDQEKGHAVMTVTAPGRFGVWQRQLAMPIPAQRYPLAMMTYRARGVEPSDEPCLSVNPVGEKARGILFRQRDIVADGKIHEATINLLGLLPSRSAGRLELRLHCRGPEPAVFELLGLRFQTGGRPLPFEERNEGRLAVRVVDRAGKGIPRATVTADAGHLNAARTVLTDADGHAVVLTAGDLSRQHTVRVAAEGMPVVQFPWRPNQPGPQTATLVQGARYGGIVTDKSGEGIAQAVVGLRIMSEVGDRPRYWTERILTDAAGRWQSPVLPAKPGWCNLSVHHPDYAPATVSPAPLHALQTGTAVLTLQHGAVLRGMVLGPNGQPVAKARVIRGAGRDVQASESVWSDAKGRFAFLPSGRTGTTLLAQCPGYAPATAGVTFQSKMEDVTIRLAPAAMIRGQVVDQGGNPVANARLRVAGYGGCRYQLWSAETDANGRFAWRDAPRDTVDLSIYRHDYMEVRRFPLVAATEEQRIVLNPPLQVTGTIRDAATGKPIPGARVVPGQYRHDRQRPLSWRQPGAPTGPDGRYQHTFRSSFDGFALRAEAGGYVSDVSSKLLPGEKARAVNFVLRRAAEITGAVFLPNGQPASGAIVCLATEGNQLTIDYGKPRLNDSAVSMEVGQDGRYRLPVEKKNWALAACHPLGYAEINSDSYGASPDLHLEAWGRIEGTYSVGSRPMADGEISVYTDYRWVDGEGRVRFFLVSHCLSATSDEQGRFSVGHVPPGKGGVGFLVPVGPRTKGSSHTRRFRLPPGGVFRVALGGRGCPIVGRFALLSGDDTAVDWESSAAQLQKREDVPVARPERPTEWDSLPLEERQARLEEWYETNSGSRFRKAEKEFWMARLRATAQDARRSYIVHVRRDGSFRAEDIPAGRYVLSVRLHATREKEERFQGKSLGVFEYETTVPKMAGGRSDKAFDLGKRMIRGIGRPM